VIDCRNYISPEIVQRRSHGMNVDVWSLGVTLYTALAGRAPFESMRVRDTLALVAKVDFDIPHYVSLAASDLILRLLREVLQI